MSEDVARQIQNKIELPVRKLGKGELKNIRLPVNIYRVVLPWEGRQLPFVERAAFSLRRRQMRRILTSSSSWLPWRECTYGNEREELVASPASGSPSCPLSA